ncbi:MAG: hypothetical protein LC799_24755, partial [Actinobacteria bacterium]|nr:hypothetical protein [Actinomycetota bacterium]
MTYLRRGRVQQLGVGALGSAFGVDGVQRGTELRGGHRVRGAGGRGSAQRGVRGVERGDALDPAGGPGREFG